MLRIREQAAAAGQTLYHSFMFGVSSEHRLRYYVNCKGGILSTVLLCFTFLCKSIQKNSCIIFYKRFSGMEPELHTKMQLNLRNFCNLSLVLSGVA